MDWPATSTVGALWHLDPRRAFGSAALLTVVTLALSGLMRPGSTPIQCNGGFP